jgi:EAL domain-containing protein (putative c-di-GMP-specific phosphodiesterase class I)
MSAMEQLPWAASSTARRSAWASGAAGASGRELSINASGAVDRQRGLARPSRAGLDVVARRLFIEFKEASTVLLPERVARFIAEMRPRGLRFVLDDFGAGPLSLRQLRDCGFDGSRSMRSSSAAYEVRPEIQALVGALVSVAHRFGMFARGQGRGNRREATELRELGMDHLQGFHFGRPRFAP